MRRFSCLAPLVVLLAAAPARAQDAAAPAFSLQTFRPAIDSKGYITVNASQILGHLDFSLGLVGSYAHDVLHLSGQGAQLDVKTAAHKRSYLAAVAKINEMYLARKYELALIELVSLEKEYPQDVRLLSMKGSLYLKLGKPKLAREAWEKALTINPEDQLLTESLRELAGRGE